MNPYVIASAIGTISGLKRVCPNCKRAQVVPPDSKHKTVRCKFCEADIPARKASP